MKASRAGLVDGAIDSILDQIIEGTIADDEALPPEAELASLLDVSRPTMREAVRSLSDRGVLRVVHGRGTFVNPRDQWRDLPTVIRAMARTTPKRELGIQLTQVRRMIEVGACGLAALNRSEADVEEMRALLDRYDEANAAGDAEAATQIDIDFHTAILQASGNPFLATIMNPLSEALYASRYTTSSLADVRERAQGHHRRIVERIAAGDSAGAKEAMRDHMTQTHDDIATL